MGNLVFDFTVDKATKTVTIVKEFSAELPLVWDAFTRQEILDQWWAPKPWKARTKFRDFTVGGYWLYAMVGPEGEEHWARADFKSIEELKGFSLTDAFCDSDGKLNTEFPRTDWSITFSEGTAVTTVDIVLAYAKLEDLEQIIAMGMKEGFTMALENLDAILAH